MSLFTLSQLDSTEPGRGAPQDAGTPGTAASTTFQRARPAPSPASGRGRERAYLPYQEGAISGRVRPRDEGCRVT